MIYRTIFFFMFSLTVGCLQAQSAWFSELMEHRKNRDEELKTEENGPIPADYKEKFDGLRYFDPDNTYNVSADFIRLKKPKSVWFATSNGEEREFFKFAEIKFTLLGKAYSLFAYYNVKIRQKAGLEKHIFVPFKDLTNLVETYGGGRYLDLNEPEGNVLQVDFNRAYNPYCAYADGYSCPKVPQENYLNLRIPAGEKNLYSDK